jgi:hypothetical protein
VRWSLPVSEPARFGQARRQVDARTNDDLSVLIRPATVADTSRIAVSGQCTITPLSWKLFTRVADNLPASRRRIRRPIAFSRPNRRAPWPPGVAWDRQLYEIIR